MIKSLKVQVIFELDQGALLRAVGHAFNGGFFYGGRSEASATRALVMAGLRDYLAQNGLPMDEPKLNEQSGREVRRIVDKITKGTSTYRPSA